jgi:serine/threonine protein kinase
MSMRGGIHRSDRPPQRSVGANRRYRLIAPLGVDRLGELWNARDRVRGEKVIVRLLPSLQRERRPAPLVEQDIERVRATLSHRNAARVVDVGMSASLPFVVSASTGNLYPVFGLLQRTGRLPTSASFSIAAQVAAALAEAHEVGTVHGCLSSASVCVTPRGHVQVLDFGLGRLNWWTPTTFRPAGLRDESYLLAQDVRELAAILLEMVIGPRGPAVDLFHGLNRQLRDRLREAAPDIPPDLLRLFDRALGPDPHMAPTADDIAEALGRQGRRLPSDPAVMPLPQPAPHSIHPASEPERPPRMVRPLRVMAKTPASGRTPIGSASRRPLLATLPRKEANLQRRTRRPTMVARRRRLTLAALAGVLAVCLMLISIVALAGDNGALSISVQFQPTLGSGSAAGAVPVSEAPSTTHPANPMHPTTPMHRTTPTHPATSMPPTTAPHPSVVRVPDVRGLTALAARSKLARSHLQLSSISPAPGPPGLIIRSVPRAGTDLVVGSRVGLVIGVERNRIHPTPSESPS